MIPLTPFHVPHTRPFSVCAYRFWLMSTSDAANDVMCCCCPLLYYRPIIILFLLSHPVHISMCFAFIPISHPNFQTVHFSLSSPFAHGCYLIPLPPRFSTHPISLELLKSRCTTHCTRLENVIKSRLRSICWCWSRRSFKQHRLVTSYVLKQTRLSL